MKKFNSAKVLEMAEQFEGEISEIPAGTHTLKIYQAKLIEKGDEVSFMLNCQAGGGWTNFFFRLSGYSEKANVYGQAQLARVTVACGVPELDLDDPIALVGRYFKADVEVDIYEGREQRRLKRIGEAVVKPAPEGSVAGRGVAFSGVDEGSKHNDYGDDIPF